MDKRLVKKIQKGYEAKNAKSDRDFEAILDKYNSEPAKPSEEIPEEAQAFKF